MDENMNYQTENEEVTETVEEIKETAEEIVEEIKEEVSEVAEEVEDVIEEIIPQKKKSKAGAIIAVVIAVVVVALAVLSSVIETNKYNRMGYVDVSGVTLQEIADSQGVELSVFLEAYGLPADMRGDTHEQAAYYMIPVSTIAQMYGMDFEALKTALKMPEEITADMTWGEAEGEITIADYLGVQDISEFKAEYGLGDEITGETKWKEVRKTVDEAKKAERIATEKAEAEAAKQEAEQGTDTETEETQPQETEETAE